MKLFLHLDLYNKTDYFLDITDPILTKDLIATISPDIIINLAALTDVDLCEKNQNLLIQLIFMVYKI